MMFNYFFNDEFMRPPQFLDLINAKINYKNPNPVSIPNLADAFRPFLFDFSYPLSSKVNKQDFENQIINYFLFRRIGTQTYLKFKMYFENRILEIIPYYNKLFDAFTDWNIFQVGEVENETSSDNRSYSESGTDNGTSNNTTSATTTSNGSSTSDRRFSKNPQNELQNVKDGKYVTEYNYDENTATDTSTSSGTNNTTNSNSNSKNGTDNSTHSRQRTLTLNNQNMDLYKKYLEDKEKIMTMIYKDLECCFFQTEMI